MCRKGPGVKECSEPLCSPTTFSDRIDNRTRSGNFKGKKSDGGKGEEGGVCAEGRGRGR